MTKILALEIILIAIMMSIGGCGSAAIDGSPTTNALSATIEQPTVSKEIQNTSTVPEIRLEKVTSLELPDSFINTVFFSLDGLTLITADWNGEVLFWKSDTWEKNTFLPARADSANAASDMSYFAGTLAQTQDGNTLVIASGENGMVTGYDRQGKELFSFLYDASVYAIAISPDGRYLAVGGFKNSIAIFDLGTRQMAIELSNDHEYISNLTFSPDGKKLVVSYERPGNIIQTWDTATWQVAGSFSHTTDRFDYHDITFSPDGTELVLATTEDIEIQILDFATMQIIREISGQIRAPYQLAFSPDGSLLASASDDNAFRLWDAETGRLIKTIRTGHEAGAVAFSPDGSLIAFSVWGEGVQVWEIIEQP
jgi:WD40 repeat protein